MIELQHVTKEYKNGGAALKDFSTVFPEGQFSSIIGVSGAGKSTLLRCINGMTEVSSGCILIDGCDITKLHGREKRKVQRRIGMIFQDFGLVEQSTVLKNVLNACLAEMNFWQVLLGLFGKKRKDKAAEYLAQVGLGEKSMQRASSLSGGEKQRTAIARVLMQGSDIILADEPVASLDPVHAENVLSRLKKLQTEGGKTVIMNSHNVEQALKYSDRIIGIREGQAVFSGRPDEVTESVLSDIYGRKPE